MPTDTASWIWVFIGAFIGIAGNLVANYVQKYLDKHFEQRRSKRLESDHDRKLYVEKMVSFIETDKGVLTVMAHLADLRYTLANYIALFGIGLIIVGTVFGLAEIENLPELLERFQIGSCLFAIGLGIVICLISGRIRNSAEMYGDVIYFYHADHQIPQAVSRISSTD